MWLNSLSKKPRPKWPLNMMLRKRRRVHMKENCQKPAFGMQRLWNPALVVGARVLRHVHKEACSLYTISGYTISQVTGGQRVAQNQNKDLHMF